MRRARHTRDDGAGSGAPAEGEMAQMTQAMGHGAGMSMDDMVRDMRDRFLVAVNALLLKRTSSKGSAAMALHRIDPTPDEPGINTPSRKPASPYRDVLDATIRQRSSDGLPFARLLEERSAVAGINVDLGAKTLVLAPDELVTEGLDGLRERYARSVLALLRRTLPAGSGLELALAGDPPRDPPARARVVIAGSDALARMLWPPSESALGEAYLRGDIDIEGDVWAAVEAGSSFDLRRLGRDLPRLVRFGLRLRAGMAPRPGPPTDGPTVGAPALAGT